MVIFCSGSKFHIKTLTLVLDVLASDANELNPWLNLSANRWTKASSESYCVCWLYIIKSDWFNFPFRLTRHTIDQNSTNRVACKNERKLNQSDLIAYNRSTQQDSEVSYTESQTDLTMVSTT